MYSKLYRMSKLLAGKKHNERLVSPHEKLMLNIRDDLYDLKVLSDPDALKVSKVYVNLYTSRNLIAKTTTWANRVHGLTGRRLEYNIGILNIDIGPAVDMINRFNLKNYEVLYHDDGH